MPLIPMQPNDGPAVTGSSTVPVDGGWTDGVGWVGDRATAPKAPWETPIGAVAQVSLRYTLFAVVPAVLLLSAVFSRTQDGAAHLLASVAVASLFVAFVALRVGWCLGCDQGMLDHANVIAFQATRAAAVGRWFAARRMAFKLPRQPRGEGYLYVVEFSTGTVKVGQTEDPKRRLGTHRAEAGAFGVSVTNYWISPSHLNFRANETRLINRCVEVSHRSRKEYFHAVTYARAVEFAGALSYHSKNTSQTSVEGVWA